MITCPCNVYPLTLHFYIVKLGFTGYTFFLILLQNIDCGYSLEPVATINVLRKTDKKIVKKSNEICHFYRREKMLYVAWACFRNVFEIGCVILLYTPCTFHITIFHHHLYQNNH